MSSELSKIMQGMLGIDNATTKAIRNMTAFKSAIVGVGAVAFGGGILLGLGKIAEAGGELEKQLGAIKSQYADITDAQTNQIRQYALVNSGGTSGATPSQIAEGFGENFTIFKNFDEALAMTAETIKLKNVIAGTLGKSFEAADDDYKKLLKSVELHGDTLDPKTGQFSVTRAIAALEDKERLMVSTKGMATAADILNVEKQGSVVLRGMDYEKADRFVAGIIQAFGGFRAGTALQAVGTQLYGGKMTEATANEMERIGLMELNGYTKRKGGGIDLKSGALTGQDLLDKGDVQDYILKVFKPAIHAAFLKFGRPGETEAAFDAAEVTKVVSTAPARRFFTEWLAQSTALLKEGKGIDMTQTVDQQQANLLANSIPKNMELFGSAWTSLMQALGDSLVKPAIAVIQTMTSAITWLKNEVVQHPEATRLILEITAGIASFMVVIGGAVAVVGGLIVLASLPAAGIVAAVVGIAAAITALGVAAYVYWDKIKIWGSEFGNWFVRVHVEAFESLKAFLDGMVLKVESIWETLHKALSGFFDKFKAFFTSIGDWIRSHTPSFLGGGGPSVHQESYRYDPNYQRAPVVQHISLHMDGQKISEMVLERAAEELSRHYGGQTGWNSRGGYAAGGQVVI